MKRDTVWNAMVRAFETTNGELADRLLTALEAAEYQGGDIRGRQAASLIVVTGKPSGVPQLDRLVDLRVDDHADPVGEVKRLLTYSRAHQRADQAIEKANANDFASALAELDICCGAYPNEPEFLFRRVVILQAIGQIDRAREVLQRASAIHPGWSELLPRFAKAGIFTVRPQMLEALRTDLSSGKQ